MSTPPSRILVTGPPGIGKTTLARRVAEALGPGRAVGFTTDEIREGGERRGFALVELGGRRAVLSHVDIRGPRVGRYGVDLDGFESFLASLDLSGPADRVVVIDEIGKMECLSARFRDLVRRLLDGPRPLLATVARRGGGLIEEVKRRPDVDLVEITRRNRRELPGDLLVRLSP